MTDSPDLSGNGFARGEAHTRRGGERRSVILDATCDLGSGRHCTGFVMNLSLSGCMIFAQPGRMSSGQDLIILRDGMQLRRGQVAWTADVKVGIRFEGALSAEMLDRLLDASLSGACTRIEPAPIQDRFGRPLAPLRRFRRGLALP